MRAIFYALLLLASPAISRAEHPFAAEGITSLTNKTVRYTEPEANHISISRGDVTAIIVDNSMINVDELPQHLNRYNGVASLKHRLHDENLFVRPYAGLNFEHIHDGTLENLKETFEPRAFPMELRVIDEHTVEVYQPPTGNWKLESCGRYSLLPDGVIEYTFECIPRLGGYRNGYIGLFWASYISVPGDMAIYFLGRHKSTGSRSRWIRGFTRKHGQDATHPPADYPYEIKVDKEFLALVEGRSKYVSTDAWYYGVSRDKMAFVQMFRPRDRIWFAQSPTGGGHGNPAWDFQWFIPDYKVGDAYGFTMRAAYLPFESREQVIRETEKHREALRAQNAKTTKTP